MAEPVTAQAVCSCGIKMRYPLGEVWHDQQCLQSFWVVFIKLYLPDCKIMKEFQLKKKEAKITHKSCKAWLWQHWEVWRPNNKDLKKNHTHRGLHLNLMVLWWTLAALSSSEVRQLHELRFWPAGMAGLLAQLWISVLQLALALHALTQDWIWLLSVRTLGKVGPLTLWFSNSDQGS